MRYGMAYQITYLIMNFILRISIIRLLGITALSLNGLFTEILSILSLAEMGVGTAITYNLYKPLAQGEHKQIRQLMNLFRKFYHMIALFMFAAGICLIPVLPYLVKKVDVSNGYLAVVYLLFLIQTCLSYVSSYKALLLVADQNGWIQAKINLIVRTCFFALSLIVIATTRNFLCYLVSEIGYTIVFYTMISKTADHLYPYLNERNEHDERDELDPAKKKEIFRSVRQMFVGKLSNRVLNSTDNILISMLVGTNMVGVYSQYSMLVNGFLRLFAQLNESVVGAVGNIIAVEEKEKCAEKFGNLTYIFFVAASVSAIGIYAAASPFLKVFIGRKYLLDNSVLLIITINLFFETLKMPLWTVFNAAGYFREEQRISLAGCILNIVVSIWWGKTNGMAGIFWGTFVSLMLMAVCKLIVVARKLYEVHPWAMVFTYSKYFAVFAAEMLLARYLTSFSLANNLLDFLCKAGIGLSIALCLSCGLFCRTRQFSYAKQLVARRLS